LIGSGAISSEDERQRVATDKQSGYNEIGILEDQDPEAEEEAEEDFESVQDGIWTPLPKNEELSYKTTDGDFADPEIGAEPVGKTLQVTQDDAEFKEEDHHRAKNGQFGSGGASAAPQSKETKKKEVKNESQGSSEKSSETAQKELHLEEKTSGSSQGQAKGFQKVKELPNGGYIDQHGFEHSPGLNEHERSIEDGFYEQILKDTPKLIAEYKATFGNKIDPDLVKKLDPSFAKDPSLAAAVHEPSSYLSKVIWKDALEQKAKNNDTSATMFTAGGSGSGKSESEKMAKDMLGLEEDCLTFDSVLGNFKSSTDKIDQTLQITKGGVDIVYTNASLDLAVLLNLKRPRTVRLDTQLDAHIKASENIKKIAEHYKGDKRVNITIVNNNTGDPPYLTEGKIDQVPDYTDRAAMRERMISFAKKIVAEGRIKDGDKKLKMLLG